jgi:hypothetical protein
MPGGKAMSCKIGTAATAAGHDLPKEVFHHISAAVLVFPSTNTMSQSKWI